MLYNSLVDLRGRLDQDGYLSIVASLALLEFDDSNNIEKILKEGEDTSEYYLSTIREVINKLSVDLSSFESSLINSLAEINNSKLSNILFEALELFKKKLPSDVLSDYINLYSEQFGKDASVYSTPTDINKLALNILQIQQDESYLEPTAGLGNAAIQLLMKNPEQNIFTQEISKFISDITKIRTILLNATNTIVSTGDVLVKPQYIKDNELLKYDVVYSDAPFSVSVWSDDIYKNDPYNRFIYGNAPKSRADWAFISNGISSLKNDGRALFIVAQGALFRGGKEAEIRKKIIELDLIESVIGLTSNLLINTAIPIAMIVVNRNKSEIMKNKIRMIDAEEIYTKERRNQRYLSDSNIEEILDLLNPSFEADNVAQVNNSELDDYNLNISRYISVDQLVEDSELGEVLVKAEAVDDLETVKLQDIAEITRGVNITKNSDHNEYKVIKISDIEKGKIDFNKLSVEKFSNNTKVENYMVQKGDLLISTRGENIKTAVIRENIEEVLVSQNLALIRVGEKLDVEWLNFYLNSPVGQFEIQEKLKGETVKSLSPAAIRELKIPLIELEDQVNITKQYKDVKETIEKQIRQLKNNIAKEKKYALEKMGLRETFKVIDK